MASGLLCIYYFHLLKRFFSFGSFKVSKVEDNGCPAFLVWSFWKCHCFVSLLGSNDNVQEDHKKQIHRAVLWHSVCDDLAQLPPFRLVRASRFFNHLFSLYFSALSAIALRLNLLYFGIYWTQKRGAVFVIRYGLPFVSKNNVLVSTINGAGAAIETIYVLIFIIYAPKKEKAKVLGLLTLVITVFTGVALVSLFALHGNARKLFCGCAAAVFSIIMYGSPLSIMRTVIKTKSVEYMPFFLSLFVFLCGTSWFVYGLLGRDPFVAVPNGVGSGLGALQLILYFIYRNNKGEAKKPVSTHSLEIGPGKVHQEKKVVANGSHDEQV
ncbi:hypothetical protein NC653_014281 [Populus alba x Populus x berolinensis]|uniref:Bidirectional sugar transporter SWEET n=1 Tax=Populus alba x Populus x berolinensis TaxID=444605 RepID=A0AAD6QWM9_9ROSI|nr:hypothetical protein NC653_014281 [Populus alba x Populus x berolinensis]